MTNTQVKSAPDKKGGGKSSKTKKKFKMPSAIIILSIILVVLLAVSWILSWSGVTYNVHTDAHYKPDGTQVPASDVKTPIKALGIFAFGLTISHGFAAGSGLIFYLIVLGAVIELVLVSGSMEAGIRGMVKGLKGKEILLIPILFTLFSAGGTIYGMSEETIALFVIIVPALCVAGFDAVTGLMVVLGGTATGCAVSTVNPFSVGSADSAINAEIYGTKSHENLGVMSSVLIFNLVWWLIMTAVVGSLLTWYAIRAKKNPEKSFQKEMKQESDEWVKLVAGDSADAPKATNRQQIALGLLMTGFVLMLLLFIPWTTLFKGFSYSTGNKDPIFGGIATLGNWGFGELSMMFVLIGLAIALVLKMPMKKMSETCFQGSKGMLGVIIVISVARGIPDILTTTGMQPYILGGLTSSIKSANSTIFIYGMFLLLLILAVFITSTSGLANAAFPIITGAVVDLFGPKNGGDMNQVKLVLGGVMIAYTMAIGVLNFFTPTNPIVMASMQYSKVAYSDGFKVAFPLGMVVLVATVALMIPSYLMVSGLL